MRELRVRELLVRRLCVSKLCVRKCVCVFVCVWTICTDVKLLSVCFVLLLLGQHDFVLCMQGDGVCFRCLHPTKTHLLHSDMDWGRSIHVPAQSFSFSSMATG